MRLHAFSKLAFLLALAGCMTACTPLRVGLALMQPESDFHRCTPDPRILCEPGSETLAAGMAKVLPEALAQVEQRQFTRFSRPFKVYAYATAENFVKHSAAPLDALGAAFLGKVHISPKLLTESAQTGGLLAHELSHLLLQERLSVWQSGRLPTWFHEGLATYVSGTGAEKVTAAQAREALRQGQYFMPEASQSPLFPKMPWTFGLTPHMFYRQSALFVEFLHDRGPEAFQALVRRVAQGDELEEALRTSYQQPLQALWVEYLRNIQKPHDL